MCDCLVALAPATAGGASLWAKSSDRPPAEPQRLEWHLPRREEAPVRATHVEVEPFPGPTIGVVGSRPWWLWGFEHGVNEAGVAAGNDTIYTTLDPRAAPPGLLGMDLVRLALERGDTAERAVGVIVELLERHGQGGTGHHGVDRPYWSSFLVADPADAWVVETSGTTWASEQVGRTRAISNRTTIPAFDAEHRHPRQPVTTLVDPRLRASRAVLAEEPVDVDALLAHQRSHVGDDGWTVCMHVDGVEAAAPPRPPGARGHQGGIEAEATTAAAVAELPVGGRPLVRWVAGSPCRSVYVPLHVGRDLGVPVVGERFAALSAERATALGELEASLAADVADDDAWAPEAWHRVDEVLTGLGV
ncbi:dipeptidase [soil metagenome]